MIDGRELGLPGELFTAGEVVPAGRYQRVRLGRERIVVLAKRAHLPPSFDGEVALYRRLPPSPELPASSNDLGEQRCEGRVATGANMTPGPRVSPSPAKVSSSMTLKLPPSSVRPLVLVSHKARIGRGRFTRSFHTETFST